MQVFEQVISEFLVICAKCDGMQIVMMLDTMFSIFDNLSDRNGIYESEAVKDSFIRASGAPENINDSRIFPKWIENLH